MDLSERDLCRKLLATLHLNVPERQALPNGRARLSVLVEVVREALSETGWFPREFVPGQMIGEGAVLESRNGELWVHEQHEVGMMRFSPIRSFPVRSAAEAVRVYVKANGGPPIDGVEIEWSA